MTSRRLGVAAALVDGVVVAGDVETDDGIITALGVSPAGSSGLAVAGFVDLQVNGFAGVDLSSCDRDGYRRVGAALARTGVTSYLATIPTVSPDGYGPALDEATAAVEAVIAPGHGDDLGARPVGIHLEGPFLSPRRAGAHPPAWLQAPDRAQLDELTRRGSITLMTVAPELPGALELIRELRRRGIVVSLGHTDADAAIAHEAFDAGATALTHTWNAHRPITSRDPGVGGVALARADVFVCAIADLVHVAAETLVFTAAAARGRFVVVSDAVTPAGLGDGTSRFGGAEVTVSGGAVRLADGTLAGSAGTLDQSVRNLVGLGVPLATALDAVTAAPARLLGRGDLGRLVVGGRADITVLADDLTVTRTLIAL